MPPILSNHPSLVSIESFLDTEKKEGKTVFPDTVHIYRAWDVCPLDDVRVVIIGQDPYHGPGQAMGLAFSVPDGFRKPPSLVNIYKELALEYPGYDVTQSGDLIRWAQQGVLLLNSVLTVRAGEPGSHAHIGWQDYTDAVILSISQYRPHVVFMLRGTYAQIKKALIDESKHLVLLAPHPSPLSAYRGWFGCGHFVQANAWLEEKGEEGIRW